jgi:hypothetical protein
MNFFGNQQYMITDIRVLGCTGDDTDNGRAVGFWPAKILPGVTFDVELSAF